MKLLLFAGAGTSIELGVPAMKGLAIEFLTGHAGSLFILNSWGAMGRRDSER